MNESEMQQAAEAAADEASDIVADNLTRDAGDYFLSEHGRDEIARVIAVHFAPLCERRAIPVTDNDGMERLIAIGNLRPDGEPWDREWMRLEAVKEAAETSKTRSILAATEKLLEAGNKWKDSDDPVDAIALANALATLDKALGGVK